MDSVLDMNLLRFIDCQFIVVEWHETRIIYIDIGGTLDEQYKDENYTYESTTEN